MMPSTKDLKVALTGGYKALAKMKKTNKDNTYISNEEVYKFTTFFVVSYIVQVQIIWFYNN